ncbi:molybdate ABC transporter substrate-binding protein [Roseomonas sp. M0104]|uniref:Molybdate ABC transporter substrate-binding protein n=1 Tax=Teichococcus coralli TaxID=2545983 RepID=A0A845BAB8_9PROT|nr:molybdate ABC transporter substrate-binding protein [Pseudoroseomonas coralli]MXP64121.1 molybdate ABC transporter substrate-binding protein [Pseudoroseomonas coralli]
MQRRTLLAALLAAPAAAPALPRRARAQAAPLTVFAAASLQDALRAQAAAWEEAGRPAPRMSFAASSTLARQIEQGAPADLFASADEQWMDYLAKRDLILPGSRRATLSNSLVLIAPPDQAQPLEPREGAELLARLGAGGRLAVGDPAHVPAGIYARQALTSLGLWQELEPRLARADNVRAALLLVERGEAPLGIVYGTDARVAKVSVVGTFPPESHPPISYPFALTRLAKGRPEAAALLDFLTGPGAAPRWRQFGFTLPG